MRMKGQSLRTVLLVGISILMEGCHGLPPGSRTYQPLPQWEAKFSAQAKRDVFPNDVRQKPNEAVNTLVVWTGVITNIEFRSDESSRFARLTVEHHYFDWTEDFSVQRARYFLSARGEGPFLVAWRVESSADQRFIDQFSIGDMLVAYGFPKVHGDSIGLDPTENLRAIKPPWFRTDVLDYGRPGEPTTILKTVF
jgi:hypothetical protein